MKVLREVGIAVVIAIAVFIVLQLNIQSYTVRYSSMLPNVREGDWIMVSKASYFFSEPQRGDVVVFDPPDQQVVSDHPFIKRVIGLPGDEVAVRDGKVFINGTPLEEDYISDSPSYEMQAIEVPNDEYFVLGDNRNYSRDSHEGWTVPRENIIGKAWFTYWPADRWGVTSHYRYPELAAAVEPQIMATGVAEA